MAQAQNRLSQNAAAGSLEQADLRHLTVWILTDGKTGDEQNCLGVARALGVTAEVRRIRSDIGDLKTDVLELKQRVGHLENQYATISTRLDRMDMRLDRIERRLDLVDA